MSITRKLCRPRRLRLPTAFGEGTGVVKAESTPPELSYGRLVYVLPFEGKGYDSQVIHTDQ